MKQIPALLLLLVVFTSCNGHATPSFHTKTKPATAKIIRTQGVVYGNVGCMLQDKAGNIWFGTRQFGLSRYNGKTFTTFSE